MQYRSRTESKRSLSPSERDRSDSGNRSNQSAQSKWRGRSHRRKRYGQGSLTQGRESSTDQQERSQRHRQLMKRIADLPTQIMQQSDHKFQGRWHWQLPIRSLDKGCSHAEQYRRWVNDMPTRSLERLDEMDR